MKTAKLRYLFFSLLADAIHGVSYAFVPLLDWAWRGKDRARIEMSQEAQQ